jgi:hypothetical protein
MKSKVYRTKVDTRDELIDHIMDVTDSIKGRQYALRQATRHVLTRVAKCTDVDGGIFEKCTAPTLSPEQYRHCKQYVIDFFLNNQPDALIIPILFCYKTPHISGIFSAHHQEFSAVHSALVSFMQVFDDRFQAESVVPS